MLSINLELYEGSMQLGSGLEAAKQRLDCHLEQEYRKSMGIHIDICDPQISFGIETLLQFLLDCYVVGQLILSHVFFVSLVP